MSTNLNLNFGDFNEIQNSTDGTYLSKKVSQARKKVLRKYKKLTKRILKGT